MPDDRRATAWTSAADGVEAYDLSRPGYPMQALDWAVSGASIAVRQALDLGAGTGKLTELLIARDMQVIAVDPSEAMLAALGRRYPEVDRRVGVGEQLPLEDGSVDLIVCGQAWHWMDAGVALGEARRVLRPGGVLSLLWNLRDEREAWVAALSDAMENHEDSVRMTSTFDGIQWASNSQESHGFVMVEQLVLAHAESIAPSSLVALALSRSHVLTRDPSDRDRILDQVRRLSETHPALAGRSQVSMPYQTVTWRARRS